MATDMYSYAGARNSATSQYDEGERLSTPVYGKAAVEGYRKDVLNGFEPEPARLNPVRKTATSMHLYDCQTDQNYQLNPQRPESSVLVDLKDPVQIHLLTETALTDSKRYTILSQEEVDDLKKLCQYLAQRIESTRQNLAIQSKYRDAAVSMARLYSHGKSDSKRRSFRSNRSSGDQHVREADQERQTCERKCEELATELFSLEKRIMEPQRKLLEHTAGILQMTHKASNPKTAAPGLPGHMVNGIPGSPESMYTYNRDHDQDSFEMYYEDSGFQQFGNPSEVSPLEIPLKSPIREQQTQLREENNALLASVADMERKFENLNMAVRDTIIRFNPAINGDYEEPPYSSPDQQTKPGEMLRYHMEYLQSGLVAIQAEQESPSLSLGPDPATEAVLSSLWTTIQTGLAGMRQRREERRRAIADKGLQKEDESEDEGFDTDEAYTLTGLDTRVRWLYRQTTTLKDQKSVLKRQIKQQRELNNKSDAEKDEELHRKQAEVDESRLLISRAEKDALDAQKMLSEALEDLEQARAAASEGMEHKARAGQVEMLESELKNARANLDTAKASSQRLAVLDADIKQLQGQLEEATASRQQAEANAKDLSAQLESKAAALKAKEEETDQMHMTMAELKTEVTLARAELDGAYGTRAERAADVAAKQSNAEVVRLHSQVETLKTELGETVKELEEITKETIGAEKEKVELESKLDDALADRTALETEVAGMRERMEGEVGKMREKLAKLQEELDGERLKTPGGSARGGAGASMLSEQFRATMREERKKFQEDLRVSFFPVYPICLTIGGIYIPCGTRELHY